MLLVLCITLLTTFSLLIAATYFQSLNNMKAELGHRYIHLDSLFILTLLEKRIKCKKSSLKKAK